MTINCLNARPVSFEQAVSLRERRYVELLLALGRVAEQVVYDVRDACARGDLLGAGEAVDSAAFRLLFFASIKNKVL